MEIIVLDQVVKLALRREDTACYLLRHSFSPRLHEVRSLIVVGSVFHAKIWRRVFGPQPRLTDLLYDRMTKKQLFNTGVGIMSGI